MITLEDLHNILERMAKAIYEIVLPIPSCPHKRSIHLIVHGSPRVRKKNAKRYSRWFMKNYKNT